MRNDEKCQGFKEYMCSEEGMQTGNLLAIYNLASLKDLLGAELDTNVSKKTADEGNDEEE